jgi:hypothetical protein
MKCLDFCKLGFLFVVSASLFSCSGSVNTNGDPHFDENGCLIKDSTEHKFVSVIPDRIKFYVEVSGSMNGFFRANMPTTFKTDVWQILKYYSAVVDSVTVLTNDGDGGQKIALSQFQGKMNTGAFVSSASTKVPVMLQNIIKDLGEGEVAVLISDMKYSPVGAAAPQVLLNQYSTDVSSILGNYGKAVSLIGATSEYIGRDGSSLCDESPYYFLVLGNPENVVEIRNGISTLLEENKNLIGNIDSGMDYGAPSYSFGIPENVYQMVEGEPAFCGYDPSLNDTCTIKLKVDLANYRWAITKKELFVQAFQCKALYGSEVKFGNVDFEIHNITNSKLERTAVAVVDLELCHMATDSEVIEWTLCLPNLDVSEFSDYLYAKDENDVSKTFSLENFIKGMFHGGVVNKSMMSNYILVSKKS